MTGTVLLLYKLTSPPGLDGEDVHAFMKTDVWPAVHQGSTRVGTVTELTLWRDPKTQQFGVGC